MTGVRPGYNSARQRAGDQLVYVTDHDKFTRHTGWQPGILDERL